MDQFLSCGSGIDFFAEFFDVTVDGSIADNPVIRVNPVHQLAATENSSGLWSKNAEELKFHRSEIQVITVPLRQDAGNSK